MITQRLTELVQRAPELPAPLVRAVLDELAQWPGDRALADAIARVLALVADGKVDAGAALPHLAMACATLCDERLTARERDAARFEIETFVPAAPAPDVGVERLLSRERTPRT